MDLFNVNITDQMGLTSGFKSGDPGGHISAEILNGALQTGVATGVAWGAILNGNENSVLKHYSYNRGLFNLLVGSSNDIFLAIGLLNPGQDDRIHDL